MFINDLDIYNKLITLLSCKKKKSKKKNVVLYNELITNIIYTLHIYIYNVYTIYTYTDIIYIYFIKKKSTDGIRYIRFYVVGTCFIFLLSLKSFYNVLKYWYGDIISRTFQEGLKCTTCHYYYNFDIS